MSSFGKVWREVSSFGKLMFHGPCIIVIAEE